MATLPREILDIAERVLDFHRLSKLTDKSSAPALDATSKPSIHHLALTGSVVKLPTNLLDVPISVSDVLEKGLDAVPQSLHHPPQNIKTLATWLYTAVGARGRQVYPCGEDIGRNVQNHLGTFPVEIYVGAWAIDGLEPGLYHFHARSFTLQKMREGSDTLQLLRRGRPDLQFLGTVPGVILASTVFCRSSWAYGRRGYRHALLECGQYVENIHATAMGLGMSTVARLRLTDSSMRELIGLPGDCNYSDLEAVQAMVVWADISTKPIPVTRRITNDILPPIPRHASQNKVTSYGSITAAYLDSVSPGIGMREIRPPLTDLTPLPSAITMNRFDYVSLESSVKSLRSTLFENPNQQTFLSKSLPRDAIVRLCRNSLRGGTFFPLKPDGQHVALIRAFWVIHDVTGFEPGIWYYDPVIDKWAKLNSGHYASQLPSITRNHEEIAHASAVCVLVSNLHHLMTTAGPDLHRIAHLEAGIIAQRMQLSSQSMDLCCKIYPDFDDDRWRQFMGLTKTGWEPLCICAIGDKASHESQIDKINVDVDRLQFRD